MKLHDFVDTPIIILFFVILSVTAGTLIVLGWWSLGTRAPGQDELDQPKARAMNHEKAPTGPSRPETEDRP